jgi:broad specificity phosphatase PhoE
MTAVFVIRHPETTWNAIQRYQGRLDTPLSKRGEEQCRRLVSTFRHSRLDAVYTSPLKRSRHLAESLSKVAGAPLRVDGRLTEMAQGPWEGLTLRHIEARHSELYRQWYSRPDLVSFPGGEDLSAVRARAQSVLADIFAEHSTGHVAVITHSVVIQVLTACALSLDLRYLHSIRATNCSVTTVCGTGAPGALFSLNSTDAVYGSAVASAELNGCTTSEPRRLTS